MVTGISHITFVVQDLERTAGLYKDIFDAHEVYDSGDKIHSLSREKFFIIGGQWVAVMESDDIVNRSYHHVAFKIREDDVDFYLEKIKRNNLEMKPPRRRIEGEGYSIYFYDYDNNLFELHTGTIDERLDSYSQVDSES